MLKVLKVFRRGTIDTRRLFVEDYPETVKEFNKRGIGLPTADELDIANNGDLHLLLSPVIVILCVRNNGRIEKWSYMYGAGYITDFATVPPVFRSMVDNDSREILAAALVHDANFCAQLVPFSVANNIFGEMIKLAGGKWWTVFFAKGGVSSLLGAWLYYDHHEDREQREMKFFSRKREKV